MRIVIIFILVVGIFSSVSFADKKVFTEEKIIHISDNGKVSDEKPFRKFTFDIGQDRIYISGTILRDTSIYSKGEKFEWGLPYSIFSEGESLPVYYSFWEKLFWSLLGKANDKIIKVEPQKIINAIGTTAIFDNKVPVTLILGETFYIMSRPLSGNDALVISIGKRVVD